MNGRVIERGTHEALMQQRGAYYDMVTRQLTVPTQGEPAMAANGA